MLSRIFRNTILDEICYIVVGMGIGIYIDHAPIYFWLSVIALIAIITLKINRRLRYNENHLNDRRF